MKPVKWPYRGQKKKPIVKMSSTPNRFVVTNGLSKLIIEDFTVKLQSPKITFNSPLA